MRPISDAENAVETFTAKLEELRRSVREAGDDPAEIKDWTWNGTALRLP